MRTSKPRAWLANDAHVNLISLLTVGVLLVGPAYQFAPVHAQSSTFADPAFQAVWERTDLPVAQHKVARSWVWGPAPGKTLREPFNEGQGGQHLVQYFDKSRMEINNPGGDKTNPFYVTNGLLVVEMISGRLQTGVDRFDPIEPAGVRIAGDEGSDAPSYGALQGVASVGLSTGGFPAPTPIAQGATIGDLYVDAHGVVIDRNGMVLYAPTSVPPVPVPVRKSALSLIPYGSIKNAVFVPETKHNVPDVFWSFMNTQGPVYENGRYASGPVVNWVYALGYPVTEPYWTQIRVAGRDRVVLFQAFQRRILTYSPDNPAGWKVEMGNVGAQYYSWRYETPSPTCARVPVRGFGEVWAGHASVQRGVGCPYPYPPYDQEIVTQSSYQPFEHGTMLWNSFTVYGTQEKQIYVFFNDGTFQLFVDTWREGEPVNAGLTPPPGLYEPERGFGKVWREGTGARVRERLGWATQPEKGGPGAYQRFERGEMYWSGAANKIWALFGTLTGSPPYPVPTVTAGSNPFRYEVYDDIFSPLATHQLGYN